MSMEESRNCQCPCGATRFAVHGRPLLRGFCHCTICQAFNQGPFADITIFRARDVSPPEDETVALNTYRPPPAARRGKCVSCERPAIEFLGLPLMPELVIVPTGNIRDETFVPAPSLHIFYDRRVADAEDALPKYAGYPRSQLAFGRRIVVSMFRA